MNETDPDQERLIAFNQSITAGCSIYKDLLKGKEKIVNKSLDFYDYILLYRIEKVILSPIIMMK